MLWFNNLIGYSSSSYFSGYGTPNTDYSFEIGLMFMKEGKKEGGADFTGSILG